MKYFLTAIAALLIAGVAYTSSRDVHKFQVNLDGDVVGLQRDNGTVKLPGYSEKKTVRIALMSNSSNSCCGSATTRATSTAEYTRIGDLVCWAFPGLTNSGSNHQYWFIRWTDGLPEELTNNRGQEHYMPWRIVNNGTLVSSFIMAPNGNSTSWQLFSAPSTSVFSTSTGQKGFFQQATCYPILSQ